jgi:hypothetical protein
LTPFLAWSEAADPARGAGAPPVESEPQPQVVRNEARTIPFSELRKEGRMVEDSSVGLDSRLIVHLP